MDKIFIGVKELSEKMGVSGKTVYRMLNDNQIPFAVKIGGQWRFRSDALDNWLAQQARQEQGNEVVNHCITVFKALQQGIVLYRIHGHNRDEALDGLLNAIPHTENFNTRNIKLSVLARESLVSSCLAGVACMAPSPERPVFIERSIIIMGFLEAPTDFQALDGVFARVIFLVLSANAGEQAILETRLRRLLMDKLLIDKVLQQPGREDLFELIKKRENSLMGETIKNLLQFKGLD